MEMHGVIETPVFIRDAARAGISDEERAKIIDLIASNPLAGDLIPGTGGARKLRVAGRGKGKSGGYRVVTYYAAEDVPILMLAVIDKGDRADLSQVEKNALRDRLSRFAPTYRDGVRQRLEELRRKENEQARQASHCRCGGSIGDRPRRGRPFHLPHPCAL